MSDLPFTLRVHYPHDEPGSPGAAATSEHILAAAANLDGAREVYTDWATRVRTVDREVTAVIKPGRYLVIALPDKETPNG